jgi:hypothetical protein
MTKLRHDVASLSKRRALGKARRAAAAARVRSSIRSNTIVAVTSGCMPSIVRAPSHARK